MTRPIIHDYDDPLFDDPTFSGRLSENLVVQRAPVKWSPTSQCHYNPNTGEIVSPPKRSPVRLIDSDTGEALDTAMIVHPGKFTNNPKIVLPPLPQSPRKKMTTNSAPLKKGKGIRIQGDVTGFNSKPDEDFAILTISLGRDPIQHFSIKVPYSVGMSLTSRPIDIIITPSE